MFSWHISDCFLCPNYSYLHSRLERHNCNSSNRTIITYRTVHKQWCHCSVARSCSLYDIHMGVRYKICLGWKQGKFIQHTQKISFVTWKTFTYNPKWWVHFFITPCFIQMAKTVCFLLITIRIINIDQCLCQLCPEDQCSAPDPAP